MSATGAHDPDGRGASPYQSRPAPPGSDVQLSSAVGSGGGHRAGSNVAPAGARPSGGGERDDKAFLSFADGIELTQADKQEGYDPSLLNLPERNTAATVAADPVPRVSSPPAAHLGPGGARNAAALPYASRVRDDSFELNGGGGGRGSKRSSRDGLNPGGAGGKARKSVRHHSSTKEGDGHRGAGGGSRRKRKKKPLKWWQKRSTLIAALVALILVVGLAVGLGVGLTVGKDDDDSGSSNSSRDGVAPTVSTGGVQPSASGIGGPGVPVSAGMATLAL
ncbi:hypothetical protein Rhopal_006977-T1 [Rhodotorula paludigena]|uniref:Uncharacterized protein n=1 Tax=Rhodotorula paludigena TaxID=86838 RepID=A0AAV5GUM1_9BASI|nr:hypothetical protein Rhopal_006977-T1 [Rhodotorula paludigena]